MDDPLREVVLVRDRHSTQARQGLPFWQRGLRRAALVQASAAASAEIAAAHDAARQQQTHCQAELDRHWQDLLADQPGVVLATLAEAFEDNESEPDLAALVAAVDIEP